MNVIKRDGLKVLFDSQKIVNAVCNAFKDVDGELTQFAEKKSQEIAAYVQSLNRTMTVEEIQDLVEEKLMSCSRKDVARSYILYRNNRTIERQKKQSMIKDIMSRVNATINERSNANVDEDSFSGREKESLSIIGKTMALDYGSLSKDVADAHKEMRVYQHDLEKAAYGIHNCLNVNFPKVFSIGFKTKNGDVRPPTSYSTACQQYAVIFQCQSQVQFGGAGSIHTDIDLKPFVKMSFVKHYKDGRKYIEEPIVRGIDDYIALTDDKRHIDDPVFKKCYPKAYQYAIDMLEKEGRQATEALYHNLNTLESRQGSQVPFTSINFGRDTSPEGRMISRWILEASIAGIGKHHLTSIFPISIFQYKRGVNASPEDPNYDLKKLALESMSKRIYPNWCNCNWSQAHEDDNNPDTWFSTMGCRTLVGYDRHGLGYIRQGRGNNTPNTIILPKLGIEYGICLGKRTEPDLNGFWDAFEETLKITEKGLLERFNIMVRQSTKSAPFMYQNKTIQGAEECNDNVYNALKHNTLAIGYIGIAEMCQAMFGKNHVNDKYVHEFALSVVKRINEFASEASARNDLNFSCYATPKTKRSVGAFTVM